MQIRELGKVLNRHRRWFKSKGYQKPRLAGVTGGLYWVTTCGSIFSVFNGAAARAIPKKLKPILTPAGYHRVSISNGRGKRIWFVHRLVAATHLGDIRGHVVHHRDPRKGRTFNHVSNLMITSQSFNVTAAAETKRRNMRALRAAAKHFVTKEES